jgi:uncharacterized protein (TIRG00374 family)
VKFSRPRLRTLIRITAGSMVGAGFLSWVWRDVDNRALGDRILEFPPGLLLLVFGLLILSAGLRAYRWSLLFPSPAPSVRRLFFVETTGIGFNNISPVRVLAEPVQFAYLVGRYRHDGGAVLASLVLVRVVDLIVTLSMITIGFVVLQPNAGFGRAVWVGIGMFALIPPVVISASLLSGRLAWARRLHIVKRYSTAWRAASRQPQRLASIVAVTAAFWSIKGVAAYVIAVGLEIDLSPPLAQVLMLAITTLGSTIPGLPSGLGPLEFAATYFLPLYGYSATEALAFGLVLHGTFLLPSIVIAVATVILVGPPWPAGAHIHIPVGRQVE